MAGFEVITEGRGNSARQCWEKQNVWGSHPPGLRRHIYWTTRRNEYLIR